jgi:hypothetical protein
VLEAVSCTSASSCTATGFTTNNSTLTQLTLAERWNGKAWAIQPTPNPGGAKSSELDAVSCISAWSCAAVGVYYTISAGGTLVERWNGKAWAIQKALSPGGIFGSQLDGVSCTSTSACTAVGYYYNGGVAPLALVERWNGKTWAIQRTRNSGSSQLNGVSCAKSTACTAVGSTASGALADRWNGKAWAIQPARDPVGGTRVSLTAVSCTASTACTAVGTYLSGGTASVVDLTLAEVWNGTAWTIQPTPDPSGAGAGKNGNLNGVSCTASTACTAVGFYTNSYAFYALQTLAEAK